MLIKFPGALAVTTTMRPELRGAANHDVFFKFTDSTASWYASALITTVITFTDALVYEYDYPIFTVGGNSGANFPDFIKVWFPTTTYPESSIVGLYLPIGTPFFQDGAGKN